MCLCHRLRLTELALLSQVFSRAAFLGVLAPQHSIVRSEFCIPPCEAVPCSAPCSPLCRAVRFLAARCLQDGAYGWWHSPASEMGICFPHLFSYVLPAFSSVRSLSFEVCAMSVGLRLFFHCLHSEDTLSYSPRFARNFFCQVLVRIDIRFSSLGYLVFKSCLWEINILSCLLSPD